MKCVSVTGEEWSWSREVKRSREKRGNDIVDYTQ